MTASTTSPAFTLDIDADGIGLVTIDMPGRAMNVLNPTLTAPFAELVQRRRPRAFHAHAARDLHERGLRVRLGPEQRVNAPASQSLEPCRRRRSHRLSLEQPGRLRDEPQIVVLVGGHHSRRGPVLVRQQR